MTCQEVRLRDSLRSSLPTAASPEASAAPSSNLLTVSARREEFIRQARGHATTNHGLPELQLN